MKKWTAWMICVCLLFSLAGCAMAEEKQTALVAVEYKKGDIDAGWDEDDVIAVTMDGMKADVTGGSVRLDGNVLTVFGEGDFLLSGEFSGRIVVDAGKNDKVRLILNGLRLTSAESVAIFVRKADKATITLADGSENTVVSGNKLISYEDEELNAAIYSKADLVINGSGSLNVLSPNGHGVLSKDDLRLIDGQITVDAAGDGVRGRDAVLMYGGEVNVAAGADGVKSNNDEDADRGYISIDGGSLTVSAGKDGIQAETCLQVMGGTVNVTESYEGMEAQYMLFAGGTVRVAASEDGINASGGDMQTSGRKGFAAGHQTMTFAGSEVYVNAQGDGVDSNGSIRFEGGAVYVSGPVGSGNGALDASGEMTVSGGILLAAGSSGMAGVPAADGQAAAILYLKASQPGGAQVSVRNAQDEETASFTPEKDWTSIVVSVPGLSEGDEVRVYVNGALIGTAEAGNTSGGRQGGWRR